MRQDEAAWPAHAHLIALAPWYDPGDVGADPPIVVAHALPVDPVAGTQCCLGHSGDDGDFGAEQRARWRKRPSRRVHRAGGVLDGDELGPLPCMSCSVRPSVGKINAVSPQVKWDRLILVEICTVSLALRRAAAVTSVSGAACTKFPPRPMKTRARPSRNARIASTVSKPFCRGGSKPSSACSRSRKWAGGRSQIPIVRSPWTLECPRTGSRPAPGLPMFPWASATLVISLIVATAL